MVHVGDPLPVPRKITSPSQIAFRPMSMNTFSTAASPYTGHRFPKEIICHAIWLYDQCALSYRDVEAYLAERGVIVTYETVRKWCLKFGQPSADQVPRRQAQPGDTWHLEDVLATINGKTRVLWRAVDQDGHAIDILVQRRRNQAAAKNFFSNRLKGCRYAPRSVDR